MNRNEQMQQMIDAYRNIQAPEQGRDMLSEAIQKAKKDVAKKRRQMMIRNWSGSIAAAVAVLILLPNLHAGVAQTLGDLPVAGAFFRAVTFRTYAADAANNAEYVAQAGNGSTVSPYVTVEGVDEQPAADRRSLENDEALAEEESAQEADVSEDAELMMASLDESEPVVTETENESAEEKTHIKEMTHEFLRHRRGDFTQEACGEERSYQ